MHRAAAGHFWNLASAQWVKKNSVAEYKFKQIIYNALNEIWYQIPDQGTDLQVEEKIAESANYKKNYTKLPNKTTQIVWIIQKLIVKFREHKNRNKYSLRIIFNPQWAALGENFCSLQGPFFLGVECGQLAKNSYCDPWDLDSRVQQLKPALHCSL